MFIWEYKTTWELNKLTSLKSNILGVQYCTMDYNDVNIEFICDTAKQC